MTSKLTPKQFNIYPATNRIKAEVMLENVVLDNFADSTIVRNALYLVRHADVSCRLNGEASIALRNLSGYQFAKLVIGMANNSVMGSDVCAYIYNFLGMNEASDPVQPAPVVTKRNLSFQEASDLLAEDPARTDVTLQYAGRERTVTKCEWSINSYWDVYADGMRYSYDQKGVYQFLWQEVTITPDNTPAAPDSEPVADVTVVAENATAEPVFVQLTKRSKAVKVADTTPDYEPRKRQAGEIVDMWGVQFRVRDNGTFEQLPPRPKCDLCGKPNGTPREYKGHVVMIACEGCMPESDTVDPQPISRVQWGKREDLLPYEEVQFSFGVQRVYIPQPTRYFNERMGYTYLQDRDSYNAPKPAKLPSNFVSKTQKVLPYMERRNRQYTGKMRKAAHRDWLAKQSGKKVLEIVSHIETPLTGDGERRIA